MDDRTAIPEQLRAIARVTECERQVWQAGERVRHADSALRQALRAAADAAEELARAAVQLDRMMVPVARRVSRPAAPQRAATDPATGAGER